LKQKLFTLHFHEQPAHNMEHSTDLNCKVKNHKGVANFGWAKRVIVGRCPDLAQKFVAIWKTWACGNAVVVKIRFRAELD